MDIKISFPGGQRVDAQYGPVTIPTNQDGSAPAPFALFLASIGTCAGIYVLSFCNQRGLNTAGLEITQRMITDPLSHMIRKIQLEIKLPAGFPEKYRDAVIRAADQCAVKKHMAQPPEFSITTTAA
ncbi:MAG TPA: OsmC family protein [bacterium]|jgi:ribosomal protein S12 methylthiotransferase accessory factor|nr:OsmC family protein [bacterium]HOC88834.1 OsmC family protein [bacterium]HOZ20144.1 OsmC family protein [bacterium]